MRKPVARILRALTTTLATLYLSATAFLYFFQEAILFAPRPVDATIAEQMSDYAIALPHDDITLHGWFIPADDPDADTIIYYGGNGDELSRTLGNITAIGDYNYLMINYRGYGDSGGAPGEAELKSDAETIITEFIRQGRLEMSSTHLIGRSLGTGVATHVAANFDAASLTLITPYDSIAAVAATRYPIFPVGLLIRHPFRSIDYVDAIAEPTLIFKAEEDPIVPHSHTDALIAAWQSPLSTVTLPGTGHNTIYTADFYQEVGNFLREHN